MNRVTVRFDRSRGRINPEIYGHFAEHIGGVMRDGLWVGEDSKTPNIRGWRKALVESFRKICPPVVRWPGGCFSETYDWRDGIGPRQKRPVRVGWWYSDDHRLEENQVGTHEFMDFCRLVGAQPYFAANATTVPALHIRNWIEYCNMPAGSTALARERAENGSEEPFGVRYWGIGNENWGGGGCMTPEMYAREYLRFATVCKNLDPQNLRLVICGANGDDLSWTRRVLSELGKTGWDGAQAYGMSLHYYCFVQAENNECFIRGDEAWYESMLRANHMGPLLDAHRAVMDAFAPEYRVPFLVDEWGAWHRDGSGPSRGYNLFEEQSTLRDAVSAALTLNIFNNRCDIVAMANIAQLCNNLQSLYLCAGDDMVETATYHVFDLFKGHQGGKQLETEVDCPVLERKGFDPAGEVSASASVRDGVLTLTLANLNRHDPHTVCLSGFGGSVAGKGELAILTHGDVNACNTFEAPDTLVPERQPIGFSDGDSIELPPASVCALTMALA